MCGSAKSGGCGKGWETAYSRARLGNESVGEESVGGSGRIERGKVWTCWCIL